MDEIDELIDQQVQQAAAAQPPATAPTAPPAAVPSDDADSAFEQLGRAASEAVLAQVASGNKDIEDAAFEMVGVAAAAQAASENGDAYSELQDKAIRHKLKAGTNKAKAKERESGNTDNEAFYARFRPILEFDFGNIIGKPSTKPDKEVESKSYSKLFMVLTLFIAAVPWLLCALVLYILKGINAVVELVRQFTKIAQGLVLSGAILGVIYAIVRIVAHYIEFYTGIKILPF